METGEFSQTWARCRDGDESAQARLVGVIHSDLCQLARQNLSGKRWMSTLNTASLINESYLKLVSPAAGHVASRAHFMNLASRVMRQVMCDFARKRMRENRQLDRDVPLDAGMAMRDADLAQARQFVSLDEALAGLARVSERQVRIIECRFFGGLSEEETAQALDISVRSVQRDWNKARSWLSEHMRDEG